MNMLSSIYGSITDGADENDAEKGNLLAAPPQQIMLAFERQLKITQIPQVLDAHDCCFRCNWVAPNRYTIENIGGSDAAQKRRAAIQAMKSHFTQAEVAPMLQQLMTAEASSGMLELPMRVYEDASMCHKFFCRGQRPTRLYVHVKNLDDVLEGQQAQGSFGGTERSDDTDLHDPNTDLPELDDSVLTLDKEFACEWCQCLCPFGLCIPYTCKCCCPFFYSFSSTICMPKMHVSTGDVITGGPEYIGYVQDHVQCCGLYHEIYNANNELRYTLSASLYQNGSYCEIPEVTHEIMDENGVELGEMIKEARHMDDDDRVVERGNLDQSANNANNTRVVRGAVVANSNNRTTGERTTLKNRSGDSTAAVQNRTGTDSGATQKPRFQTFQLYCPEKSKMKDRALLLASTLLAEVQKYDSDSVVRVCCRPRPIDQQADAERKRREGRLRS
ncbi:unnamed protein product [Amoebophrya sp. A25]|nr:unnamed protein product [Amoebophrya sp. A25]|eukprot:GSA25T00010452001.1